MAFVILNADNSIHSFQLEEYEQLDTEMRRFDIDIMPNFSALNGALPSPVDVECYSWDNINETIILKTQTNIDTIMASRKTASDKLEKMALQGEIDNITTLETSDSLENYSVEKAALQAKLDALKVV